MAQWMRPHTPSAAPRWGSRVPHTTTQPRSPSWTGHSEDTGLLKKKRQRGYREKRSFKGKPPADTPTAKRARGPRRQPDPHPPFTEPQTTWGRAALQNQDGTWAGYHPANLRQESLQSVPLPRSLPGSAPFPDAPPGQDAQHPDAPPPPRRAGPYPLCRFVWVSAPPQAPRGPRLPPAPGQARHCGGPGCQTGESAPPRPAPRRARCPATLGSQDPAEAPGAHGHLVGSGHAHGEGTGGQLGPTDRDCLLHAARRCSCPPAPGLQRDRGTPSGRREGRPGGLVVLTSQPRPQAKADQCRYGEGDGGQPAGREGRRLEDHGDERRG